MLIGLDEPIKPKPDGLSPSKYSLAQPLNRLAAFVIDHVIILPPIVFLLNAPIEARIKESLLIGQDYRAGILLLLTTLFSLFIVFAYHFICNLSLSSTLGQKFFKIQVVGYESGAQMSFKQALLRSFGFILNSSVFFIGGLSIYSHGFRRTFYDQISDSLVITHSDQSVAAPSDLESFAAHSVMASVVFVVFAFIVGCFYMALSQPLDRMALIESLEDSGQLCEEVSDAGKEWPIEEQDEVSRLSIATALYFSGEVDASCLKAELNPKLILLNEDSLFYLVKAILFSDEEDLASSYLDASCARDINSPHCKMGLIIQDVKASKWDRVPAMAKIGSDDDFSKAPIYLRLWLSQKLVDLEQFSLAEKLLKSIPDARALANEMAYLQVQIFIGMGQTEKAQGALSIAKSHLSDNETGELLGALCQQEMASSCTQALQKTCADFSDWVESSQDILSLNTSLVYVDHAFCKKTAETLASSSSINILNFEAQKYLNAQISYKRTGSTFKLKKLSKDDEISSNVRLLALTKLLDAKADAQTLLRAELMSSKIQPGSVKLGQELLNQWTRNRDFEKVISFLKIREKQVGDLDINSLKHLVISEYHMGQIIRARQHLSLILEEVPFYYSALGSQRQPASLQEQGLPSKSMNSAFENEFLLIIQDLQ